jgi:ATP-dependent Lhr-like helicase
VLGWIWDKGWTSLREIQAYAIDLIVRSASDVLIAASTASGKTEAAFLPILSCIAAEPGAGIQAVYIGPLKALINDQFQRLEDLCERLQIPVTKWHGDASDSQKRRLREKPAGVLLITPESLEALFMRRPELLRSMFGALRFVVIDELHAFMGNERGVQLASLLKRLDHKAGVLPRRIGLSATIGDLSLAEAWLRPDDPKRVRRIESPASAADLQLQIRGIVDSDDETNENAQADTIEPVTALGQIADHIFQKLRAKGNHLVFAGSRRSTEELSDLLRRKCEAAGVPNEYFPHHGNLSRETRESLESRLKAGLQPTTAVATTTLELGIDIGSVESIVQIGAPSSISSLRQRLGRSGRREGKAAVMRIYATESKLDERSSVFDRLRVETVQAVAAVRLLLTRWVESPDKRAFHLSTLLHQILSVITERGGIAPAQLYKLIGGKGPFEGVNSDVFAQLLRSMHDREHKLIEQASDGTLMLGPLAEKLTSHYDFYSVFVTYDESTIATEIKTLGTLSVTNALGPGDYLTFAGQRWRVKQVDDLAKRILVEPSPAGRVPKFLGEAAPLSDRLAQEMRAVYTDTDVPPFLDSVAKAHLVEARSEFAALGMEWDPCVSIDGRMYIFPWVGTEKLDALRLALRYCGLQVEQGRIALSTGIPDGPGTVLEVIRQLSRSTPPSEALALMSETLRSAKYDNLLPDDLLRLAFINDKLDLDALADICRRLAPPQPLVAR